MINTKKEKKVSIITPCYNGGAYLTEYFESILAQKYTNIELIFVDDGSTDNSRDIAEIYGKQLEAKKISFKYIYQENKGQAAAINEGFKHITGEYLMWMDADDIMYPDKIDKQVKFLEENDSYQFVQCWYEFVDEKDTSKPRCAKKRRMDVNPIQFFEDLINGVCVCFSGIYLVKIDALKSVLGKLEIYEGKEGQNWQLLLPLSAQYSCGYVEEVLYKVVEHSDSHSRRNRNYKEEIERIEGLYNILENVITGISSLSEDYKKCGLKKIKLKYINDIIQVAKKAGAYDEWKKAVLEKEKIVLDAELKHNEFIVKHDKCFGCGACEAACDNDAIELKEDKEGFLYPDIDSAKCVNCMKCKEVCPALHLPVGFENLTNTYYFRANEELLEKSSSGGAFGAISQKILARGGFVCGCAFDSDFLTVKHIIINKSEDLPRLQKSKYIQSYTGNIFEQIYTLLEEGKEVLFTGTPCQVAGLKGFLQRDYDNLITIDLVCHGVPSHMAWENFLDEDIAGHNNLVEADFRDNSNKMEPTLRISSFTTTTYSRSLYYKVFSENIDLRKSCGVCPYPYHKRPGDITIGDYWGIEKSEPKLFSKAGNSAIIVNNSKGEKILKEIEDTGILQKVPYFEPGKYNQLLLRCSKEHPGRNNFYKYLNGGMSFSESYRRAKCEMFDFGLVSWYFAPNYGAALTAFALCRYLTNNGYSVLMLDIPEYVMKNDKYSRLETSPTRDFIERYCITSRQYKDEVDLLHINMKCKNFIVGSDQLWNYSRRQFFEDGGYYFLDFAGNDKGRFSYATSFGESDFRDDVSNIDYYLKKFDCVSVREQSGLDICKKMGVDADLVLDPVFLLDKSEYEIIASANNMEITLPYIFVYMISSNQDKWDAVLKEAGNSHIIYCPDLRETLKERVEDVPERVQLIKSPTVEQWLNLINKADKVLTDSYHGICMSIILEKPYIQLQRKEQFGRFDSLYEMLGLEYKGDGKKNNKFYEAIKASKEWIDTVLKTVSDNKPFNYGDGTELQIQWKMIRELQDKMVGNQKMLMKIYLEGRLHDKKVLIRGGGRHTEELLLLLGDNVNVLGIWDASLAGMKINGIECYGCIEEISKLDADIILISSFRYKEQMLVDVREKFPKIEVVEPYSEWKNIGFNLETEFYKY